MTTQSVKIVWWVVGVIIVVAAVWYFVMSGITPTESNATTTPAGIVCTMDARLCPDGTYVGRTGPNCEFVCPTGTSSSTNGLPGNQTAPSPADIGK